MANLTLDLVSLRARTEGLSPSRMRSLVFALMHVGIYGGLPADLDEISVIMRITEGDRIATAQTLLDRFFTRDAGGFWHPKPNVGIRVGSSATLLERARKASEARWAGHVAKRPSRKRVSAAVASSRPATAAGEVNHG